MTPTARRILEAAPQLSADEREELVVALSSSLESRELSDEWGAEIERRLEFIGSREVVTIDADEHLRLAASEVRRAIGAIGHPLPALHAVVHQKLTQDRRPGAIHPA